ncbi:hypothetical protein Barb4_02397 [Bacteroidales bacterium Barb4]|nr:hypothetical protein Barb4_02397 [Bacteroidales bacterium Barb4]
MKKKITLLSAMAAVLITAFAVSCSQTDDVPSDDSYSIEVNTNLLGEGVVSFDFTDAGGILNAFGDIEVHGSLKSSLSTGVIPKTGKALAELHKSNSIPEIASASGGIKGTVDVILKTPYGSLEIYHKSF